MKKYTKRIVICGLICIFLFFCIFLFAGKPKTGKYIIIANDTNEQMFRGITINMEAGSFELTGSFLNSQIHQGTFIIDGNKLVAMEDGEKATYVFDIMNGMTLKFNKEQSVGWIINNVQECDGEAYYIYVSDDILKRIFK